MFCISCGKSIEPGDNYCRFCGTPVSLADGSSKAAAPPIAARSGREGVAFAGAQSAKSASGAHGKRGGRKLKLLVIDDDPVFLETYLFKFEKEGFDVVLARSGAEGLKFALVENPSVILLDILMPGMNGLEVLRRLKEDRRTRDIPVVLATVVDEKGAMEQGLALGADYYITKDVMNSDGVVDKVREAALGSKSS